MRNELVAARCRKGKRKDMKFPFPYIQLINFTSRSKREDGEIHLMLDSLILYILQLLITSRSAKVNEIYGARC